MALNITGLPTTNVTGGPSDGAFKFDGSMDPAPTDKAMGGTELMRKWLFENVDNDLLNRFQIISSRVRELEDKPRILWLHDTHDDPESEHLKKGEDRKRFDKLVFVSDWQKQAYEWSLGIRPSENVVIKNAISPFMDRRSRLMKLSTSFIIPHHIVVWHFYMPRLRLSPKSTKMFIWTYIQVLAYTVGRNGTSHSSRCLKN